MTDGVSIKNGLVHHVGPGGIPLGAGYTAADFSWDLVLPPKPVVPVIMIHGFNYNPWRDNDKNPHWTGEFGAVSTFGIWRRGLLGDRPSIGLGWYSVPAGRTRGWIASWLHGRYNPYRYAWDLAAEAGDVLAVLLRRLDGPADLLCHSLGSRVVLAALALDNSLPVQNVVIMNGAELVEDAILIARRNKDVRFTNLVVRSDKILSRFGAVFAPKGGLYAVTLGQGGLGSLAPPNWRDVDLDRPITQAWGRQHGWDLRGDNPDSRGDHWFTYRHDGNKAMIRAALTGTLPLPPRAD